MKVNGKPHPLSPQRNLIPVLLHREAMDLHIAGSFVQEFISNPILIDGRLMRASAVLSMQCPSQHSLHYNNWVTFLPQEI